MQTLICTLEFKEGRPVAKEQNPFGETHSFLRQDFTNKKNISETDKSNYASDYYNFTVWQTAESNRREFEIDEEEGIKFGLHHYQNIQRMIGTKIELIY